MSFVPVTLFRAVKKPNGQVVCVDPEYLTATCKAARTESDYLIMVGQGWVREPQEALDRFEAEEQTISRAAAERAYDDRHLSEPAQREVEAYESTTGIKHVAEVPELVRKRGRPKKVVVTDGDGS